MDKKFNRKVFERPKLPLGDIFTWLAIIVMLYICAVFFAFSNTFDAILVSGDSMIPTYNKNGGQDTVYAKKSEYTYGDIILVDHSNKTIIKRVVALAGDRVEIKLFEGQYRVYLNGEILDEEYINDISGNRVTYQNLLAYKTEHSSEFDGDVYVVGENKIFALGDNRAVSRDSSCYGAFDLSRVQGKVFYKVNSGEVAFWSLFVQMFLPFLA